jgi:DinB superfamily
MDLRAWLLDAHSDLYGRLTNAVVRQVPTDRWIEQADGGGSSIAWLLLHLARHQDLALTTVIRNHVPLYLERRGALGLGHAPTWAGLPEREDPEISAAPDPDALLGFVEDVFTATTRWLEQLSAMALDTKPDVRFRLEHHALLPVDEVGWLFDMWADRTVDWFVQWPILGHGNAHVGEAISVRNRLGLSPF